MKNKKLLKIIENEIHFYAITHTNKNIDGFIKRIFAYLRANLELLQDENHKKLYDECILVMDWLNRKEDSEESSQNIFENVIDCMNQMSNFHYSKEIVENYLNFRIDAWNSGYYDELEARD